MMPSSSSSSSSPQQSGGGNHLDPAAQAFYPSTLTLPPIYYPYPLPPPPPAAATLQDTPAGRAVLLTTVPRHLTEDAVRAAMAPFGAVRAVEARNLASDGSVTAHFYDLRSAQAAVAAVREQHIQHQSRLQQNWVSWDPAAAAGGYAGGGMLVMHHQQIVGLGLVAGHAVWAQFAARELDGQNQGSLVVFNWDSSTSLAEIFQSFGDVKDVRDATSKPHKFVDFFDTRDAARAVAALNGREIMGRRLAVEFARLGGPTRSSGIGKRSSSNNQGGHVPPRLLRSGSGGPHIAESSMPVSLKSGEAARSSGAACSSSGGRLNKVGSDSSSSNNRNPSSTASSSKRQQQQSKKEIKNQGKSVRDRESTFHFKDVGAMVGSGSGCRDSRTTVMIKNIPNKYSQKLLLNMLDSHCINCNLQIGGGGGDEEPLSAYDFVYLPIDFNNKCNVGYGFVNLTSPQAAVRLHKAFHMQPWEVFNSRKICEVTYARLQGLEVLKRHFTGSKFACDDDEYMPVEFSPPRDGVQLTEPVPVGCRINPAKSVAGRRGSAGALLSAASSTTASTHAPSDIADGDEVITITGGDDDDGAGGCGGSDGTGSDLSEALGRLSCSQQS